MFKFIDTVLANYSSKEEEIKWNDTLKYFDYIKFNEIYRNYYSKDGNAFGNKVAYNVFKSVMKSDTKKVNIWTKTKTKFSQQNSKYSTQNDTLVKNLRFVSCIIPPSQCKYIFKSIFETIQANILIFAQSNQDGSFVESESSNKINGKKDFNHLLKELNDLFGIENNRNIILKNYVYFPTLKLLKIILEVKI